MSNENHKEAGPVHQLVGRIGYLTRFSVLWISGRDFLKLKPDFPPHIRVYVIGVDLNWRLYPFGGKWFQVSLPGAPNVLHRILQFIILGHRYEMTPVFDPPNATSHQAGASPARAASPCWADGVIDGGKS